jgi:uncharacterized protein
MFHSLSEAAENPIILPLKMYALRFASESGAIDAQGALRLLEDSAGQKSGQWMNLAKYSFEAVAILSPLTFSDFVVGFETKYPEQLVQVMGKAVIPLESIRDALSKISGSAKNEISRTLIDRALNGSPSEIAAAIELFWNPSEIALESAVKLTLAAAIIGPKKIDAWLERTDEKNQAKIFNQIYVAYLQDESKIFGWELRFQNLLGTKFFLRVADKKVIGLALGKCNGPNSVNALLSVAERLRNENLRPGDSLRAMTLWYATSLQAENEGIAALLRNMENGKLSNDSDLMNASISALVRTDRVQAKKLLQQANDPEIRTAIQEQLLSQTDPRESNQERQQLLNAKLDTVERESDITDALKKRIEYLVQYEAEYDRPAAITLLSKLPDGVTKEKMFGDFAKNWTKNDPVSASDWIATLPPSRIRDAAVNELVQASHDDPEIAFQNAAAIADKDIRRKAAISIIERWKPLNPDAISTLLDASPLALEDKTFLAQRLVSKDRKGGEK